MGDVCLAELLRGVGSPVRFRMLRALSRNSYTPTVLGRLCDMNKFRTSNHLGILRDLGFVDWSNAGDKDDRHRLYYICDPLPSIQHEILVDLIRIDQSEPKDIEKEARKEAFKQKALREKIEEKTKELFWNRMGLLLSSTQLPVGMMGKEQKRLRERIRELKLELKHLTAENREFYE
ncbi:MAG: ArsR/SmtB family transcription factor [bacterium]